MKRTIVLVFLAACFLYPGSAHAAGTKEAIAARARQDNMKGSGARVQEYDEIVSPDMVHSGSYANRARIALKNGNVSRALALSKKAMQLDDDDLDTHAIYAQSLEAVLARQSERDEEMFRKCIQEWLIVYRSEAGEEKGTTIKGISIMGTWWNDEARGGLAKIHLRKLTGYVPKAWETDNHYLKRVTTGAQTSVKAKLREKED